MYERTAYDVTGDEAAADPARVRGARAAGAVPRGASDAGAAPGAGRNPTVLYVRQPRAWAAPFLHLSCDRTVYDPPAEFREFIDSLDDLTTMLASLAERDGHDTTEALSMATVAIAAIRGLLLQQVLTPTVHSKDAVALILRMSTGRCAPPKKPLKSTSASR